MKRFAAFFVGLVIAVSAMAEASFDQIQTLIQQQQYSAAAAGLEGIIANHPKSAKAFYAMAQAQAGMGNLEKARKALDIATGLNPTLDFAPASSVQSLRDAVTPQAAKIVAVEESHTLRNFVLFAGFAAAMYFLFTVYMRKQEEEAVKRGEEDAAALKRAEEWAERQEQRRQAEKAQEEKEIAEYNAKQEAIARMKAHPNYNHERFDPANPDKLKSVKQFKEEKAALVQAQAEAEARRQRLRAEAAEEDARQARNRASYSSPAPTTTVVNNSGNDMLTGVLIGNMLSGSHHHDTERTVVRETVREVEAPAKAPRSSWDDIDTPKSSRNSSWDDDSSSRSSSWDNDSSSSSRSSSSWSSSSSSDSSSSWSSSDSSSSSSWD